ncbi:MAG: hypothetical protein WC322_00080 [Candidatus Paceibacterota bacterium]|jgi:crossover junction endodeoxyribonuclease RusA
MRIELPWPDPKLMPNRKSGRHWAITQAVKVRRRDMAWALTREAMQREAFAPMDGQLLPIKLTFFPPSYVRRDLDGLLGALKPDVDGMARALGVDDQFFEPITLARGSKVKGGAVVVEVGNA